MRKNLFRDYNNRIKEWITNLMIEELNEDDSWWTSMSEQQQDYIKKTPTITKKDTHIQQEKGDDGGKDDPQDWYDNNKIRLPQMRLMTFILTCMIWKG